MKKYLNIREVSKLIGIKEHVIRYWDSIEPKTNKLRVEGISTKTRGGTRYFNKENISKLEKLKNVLYDNGTHNHSLILANRMLSKKNSKNIDKINEQKQFLLDAKKTQKFNEILKNIRILLK